MVPYSWNWSNAYILLTDYEATLDFLATSTEFVQNRIHIVIVRKRSKNVYETRSINADNNETIGMDIV